ncbi:Mismatch repair protein msh3 [Dissophora globulifera]|uniref:DNA mismatch repair protein n=1 Tax=Dissophora globulifera TaxID=979702 RepID=A0A9P6UWU3_9FUNG|nr:Mismatch repair protein msh3 [Dissophora globulifera]
MVDRKGAKDAPPPVQKTLLSFFKPKSPAIASSAPAPTPGSVSESSESPSKRKGKRDTPDDAAHATGEPPSRRRRTLPVQEAAGESIAEEPLFPSELSSEIQRFTSTPTSPSFTTSTSKDRSLDDDEPEAPARKTRKTSNKSLSQFEYSASKTEADQSSVEPMDVEQQEAEDRRRERFRKKLGFMATPASALAPATAASPITDDSTLPTMTSRRRRLIVSESDEDMDYSEAADAQEQVDDEASASRSKSARPSRTTPITNSRSANIKKATKSPYTPLEKQFVEIKEQNPDAVLCIEVGYKFRFFGEDAEIASRELSIAHFMDHNFYTANWSMLATSLDQDEEQFQGSFVGKAPSSQYLMCICEQPQGGSGTDEKVRIAMLAVQPATGDIIYDEFVDGHFRNELETRLLHIQPAELIVPMEPLSKATEKILGYLTGSSNRGGGGGMIRSQDDVRIERTAGFVKYDRAFALVSDFYSSSLKEEQQQQQHTRQGSGAGSLSKTSQMEALLKTVLGLSRSLIIALSAMITHLSDFGLAPIFKLSKYFECFTSRSHMLLNGNTISNLEIYRNQTDWSARGSLFGILDHTVTGFGRRLLKKWVGKPLVDRKALQERVDAVEEILELSDTNDHLQSARNILKGLMDLEKGVCRVHYGKSSPKEFLAILKTFMKVSGVVPPGFQLTNRQDFGLRSPMLQRLIGSLGHATEDTRYFLQALNEYAARKDDKLLMFQEDVIADKWPEILEHRNNIIKTEEELAAHLEQVRKLLREPRLEFATVSGIEYLVEVKNKETAKVPKSWVKISGTKQVSRFHTPDAIQLIQAKTQHQERLVLACDKAFLSFQQEFSERYEAFRDLVQNLAVLDCLFSLSTVACLPGYVKPEYVVEDEEQRLDHKHLETDDSEMVEDTSVSTVQVGGSSPTRPLTIEIKNGRHPMVEQMMVSSGNYVPNSVHFHRNDTTGVDEKTMILTGPNMGGKSCYIRQVALLCIMAQIGSYLPAESAKVSLLDAVYTRMGASDNIFGHESTFMVELQETSDILKMATPRSLVILDELGRGTSTLDGVAIAYAVLKHVVSHIRATTLFVTHYPSLAEVANEYPEGTVRNFHMGFMASTGSGTDQSAAKTEKDLAAMETESEEAEAALDDMDIVFLYKLVPGVSLKSYGLNVARMAKLPLPLIAKAKVKSKELESILERRLESRRQQRHGHKSTEQQCLLTRLREIQQCASQDSAQDIVQQLRSLTLPS